MGTKEGYVSVICFPEPYMYVYLQLELQYTVSRRADGTCNVHAGRSCIKFLLIMQ